MTHFLLVMLSQLLPVDYTDHALVTFTPQSTLEAERARNLGRFAGCCEPRGLGPQHRVLTQAELNLATQMGLSFEVTTNNVGQAIQEARAPQGLAGTSFFDDYRTNEEIDVYLDQLVATYPGVSRSIAGESIQGRPIHFLRFGSGPQTVAITAGQHAREWINPAATLWMVEDILRRASEGDREIVDLLARTNWLVVPISNPDGYAYSHTGDGLWRKNRRNIFPDVGVDLNRNWGAGYGGPGSSSNPSDETYRGLGAFSEPETAALRTLLEAEDNLLMCLDIHSFGQLVLSPYGYQDSEPTEGMGPMLSGLAFDAAIDMLGTHGSLYTPIPAHDLYLASGIASDWSWDDLGAPSWTFELRPVGGVGFLLPPDQIVPTGEELTEAVRSLAERLLLGRGRPIAGPSGVTSQSDLRLVGVVEPLPGRTMQGATLYLDGPDGQLDFLTEDLGDNRIAADVQGVLAECTEEATWWLEAFDNEGTT
ncbi:MAG: M14 family zinc carboxypeptidase, partial [Planctomycetota bacterium]|nr:M14 family zinc carboxypeptidase [Planctomycetota bacterium]